MHVSNHAVWWKFLGTIQISVCCVIATTVPPNLSLAPGAHSLTVHALGLGITFDRLEVAFTGAPQAYGPGRETRLGAKGPASVRIPADQAAPREDKNSEIAHADLLRKAKQGRIDVYFEGDSITRRWGATDYPDLLANWNSNFFGWNAADFGWGADKTQNIIWRLENGELNGIRPKVIVLLAGTNNVGEIGPADNGEEKVVEITRGMQAIVRLMQKKAPDATIVLMGIFPRNDHMEFLPVINGINGRLAKLADGKKVRYLNINDKLADSNGKLFEGMMNTHDRLHPTVKAYQVWADALKPLFTELLGPPAKEDHAPSPTGDPSARH